MIKIPVGKTIAHAYGFAFRDFLQILGVMWLPMAIMWAPGILLQQRMLALQARMHAGDPSVFQKMGLIMLPIYLLIFLFLFMQIIGIAKLALGVRKGPSWFYFSLGKPVWRLIGSCLLLIIALIVGWIVALLGGILVSFLVGLLTKAVNNGLFTGVMGVIAVVAMIAMWCAYIYALVRLTFLLVPIIAAEEPGFALAESWTLGLGNFWRIFVILLAVLGPFFALEFIFIFAFMFHGMPFPTSHADPAQAAAFQAAMNARVLEITGAMSRNWFLTYPIFVVVMVLFYGAAVGAQCFAWRALTESEASSPVAAD